jgi:hypothetical protein
MPAPTTQTSAWAFSGGGGNCGDETSCFQAGTVRPSGDFMPAILARAPRRRQRSKYLSAD